ncbi:uncharacterized protein LOC133730842 [Rosa rugosa]|uniref:uncharacterized protein LOC133730842 n=1 Tax=Rosa rugosa TaxID=74645 RepID=UPI002B40B494|nr:uncharacterized protein LOC133730842 [Rosa rugosa]
MGSKNIYAYNLAMLGKQGWRLLSNPQSLIGQLYKAKYFPNCSFWEAELGESPSFSWRSILSGRPLFKAGVQWCIGDRTQVSIWNDRWIPMCPQYLIHKPPDCVFELVSDLIDAHTRQWIPEAIHTIFPPDIAKKVLSITLSRQIRRDKLCWSPEKKGCYFVKTAYWIARTKVLENVLVSTSHGNPFLELWRRLWQVGFKEWMLENALHLKKELFAKLLMIFWALWKNRNDLLWNGTKKSADALVLSSLAWLEDYTKAQLVEKSSHSKPRKTWTPATSGIQKLNVDGSFIPNTTLGGVGGVLRDGAGQFHAAFAKPIPNVASARQVELRAVEAGLNLVATLQLSTVVIETDCMDVISSIGDMQSTYVHEEGLIDNIRQVLHQRPHIFLQYAPRACNRVAHRLANLAYEDSNSYVWIVQPPDLILELLKNDCKPLG